MVRLLIIRHGETNSNKNSKMMGQSEVPLNEIGRQQAKLCGLYLLKTKIQIKAFYSSTLLRARETAEIIAKEMNLDKKIQYISDLTERSFGELEGKSYSDVRNQLNNKNGNLDITIKPPNGESALEFYARVKSGIENILKAEDWEVDDIIVLLTHGGTIRHILGYLFCEKDNKYNDFPVDPENCSLTLLNIDKNGKRGSRIEYLNYYHYLQNSGT